MSGLLSEDTSMITLRGFSTKFKQVDLERYISDTDTALPIMLSLKLVNLKLWTYRNVHSLKPLMWIDVVQKDIPCCLGEFQTELVN